MATGFFHAIATGDFNGDGKPDLVAASADTSSPGYVSVSLGNRGRNVPTCDHIPSGQHAVLFDVNGYFAQ